MSLPQLRILLLWQCVLPAAMHVTATVCVTAAMRVTAAMCVTAAVHVTAAVRVTATAVHITVTVMCVICHRACRLIWLLVANASEKNKNKKTKTHWMLER
jgi:hypothetical protein